ncbi:MAG TPA: c-type cytochrome, partial [Gemmatimonadales bacterium]|nr:c-type cytochrome [Gemmatimonadales bacterium]
MNGPLFRMTAALVVAQLWAGAALRAQASRDSLRRGNPAAGRRVFHDQGCVRCHSVWGSGGRLGPDLATVGAGRSMLQFAGLFWNHTPRMIETVRRGGFQWPRLSAAELSDVMSYLYYVKLFDEPGDAVLGERWFRAGRCVQCHRVGDIGGRVGPSLDRYARYVAPIPLAQGMWNHGPAMQAAQRSRGVTRPTFAGREMADIQAFIRSASTAPRPPVVFLEPPDPDRGRLLFVSKGCANCHGRAGRGSQWGPDLRSATVRLRMSEIAGVLWNHSFEMSAAMQARGVSFPRFEGSEMADVIAFLYYLRFDEAPGDSARGAAVFRRLRCSGCHQPGRDSVGPDLTRSNVVMAPMRLAAAMWNHAPAMYDEMRARVVEWPRFEGDEMRDLAAYLRSRVR